MDLGFETIGNATVICHDRGPLLATDPWLDGSAYFGSWVLESEIPAEQRAHVEACRYLWISHGHPDHLSPASLERLRDKTILLADHVGGRIRRDLEEQGFEVRVLADGSWTRLSERVRVLSIADVMQDAILLIDLDGTLVVDANDCGDHGVGDFLHRTAAGYDDSYLLCLTGYGDADMINFFDEQGRRIPPPAAKREPLGPGIAGLLAHYGIKRFVPFSSMHRYNRTDSAWANEYITPLHAHAQGFSGAPGTLLPPYARVDLATGDVRGLAPAPAPDVLERPEAFGDDWSDELDGDDRAAIAAYLAPVVHLRRFLGYLNFRVGGKDNVFDVAREHFDRGITFETPRASLMTSIRYEIFDDVLIGNFARTTLHGDWGGRRGTDALYPDFGPFLTKYGDNGRARSAAELRDYFREYRRRGFFDPSGSPGEGAIRLYAG